ncbi:galactose-1-phosphate uridylyltransferase [Candidatus Sumerlaeota bacterium]|nr:galactose-1-phosphate uridylyltransferase [Candidatus Sumerlaeota bacterium]
MSDLRRDPVIGRWVIVAAERSRRPSTIFTEIVLKEPDVCPFCDGNEHLTPPEILAFRKRDSQPDRAGWWVRVVPNKFPAVDVLGNVRRAGEGMFDMMNGVGAHEVVIEAPSHDASMADMPSRQIEEVFWAYRERMIDLQRDLRFRYVLVFKNQGPQAGATLAHAHSQIIALPIVPKRVQEELNGAEEYFRYKERCVFCDVIHQEQRDRLRVVGENDLFIAFHPFASRFPFETWILPRNHESSFTDIQIGEVRSLAAILKDLLMRFRTALSDPDFNYVIHTTPFSDRTSPHFHWHIELIPRLTHSAGFEWGTGFYINPVAPEEAAQRILNAREAPADNVEEPPQRESSVG